MLLSVVIPVYNERHTLGAICGWWTLPNVSKVTGKTPEILPVAYSALPKKREPLIVSD